MSRPLGDKPVAIEDDPISQQETQFLYTTTAPPPLQAGARDDVAPVAWEMPHQSEGGEARASTQASSARPPATSVPTPPSPPPPRPVDLAETAGFRINSEASPPVSELRGGLPERVIA
ncbi:MAG: hypothetical protein ACRDG4_06025, partial [Chloroflexota bacterium]